MNNEVKNDHPYLVVSDLEKRFGDFVALRDLSLSIKPGEFVCFLGPSGCGKTTLLRVIAGLERQSSGRIEQAGRDISDLPPAERDFGIVFQSYALFPNLTIEDNVSYGLVSWRADKAQIADRTRELLDLVNLKDQAKKYPVQLSGGQQQRVALSRALAPSPGLLLLDEPLSALDAKVRQHLRQEIRSLQRRLGVTTIMVTHDQEEALTMADRVVVMNHGVIEQVGTPIEIYRQPASAFVADFIGSSNMFDCQIDGEKKLLLGNIPLIHNRGGSLVAGPGRVAIHYGDVAVHDKAREVPNEIECRVLANEFLGQAIRITMQSNSDAEVCLTADVPADVAESLLMEEGATLWAALPPDQLQVFSR